MQDYIEELAKERLEEMVDSPDEDLPLATNNPLQVLGGGALNILN